MSSTQLATKADLENLRDYIDQQIDDNGGVSGSQGAPGTSLPTGVGRK